MRVSTKLRDDFKADPILYRTYYSLMMEDILFGLRFNVTKENKRILHDFHKRVLGYKSTSGISHDRLSTFLLEVAIFWGERGIFVRSSGKQEPGIENKSLKEVWGRL